MYYWLSFSDSTCSDARQTIDERKTCIHDDNYNRGDCWCDVAGRVCSNYSNGSGVIHIVWRHDKPISTWQSGRRSSILGTSTGVAVSNMLFIAFYLLMTQSSYDMSELVFYVIAATASGILSGALTIGLMPFFESAFRLAVGYKVDRIIESESSLIEEGVNRNTRYLSS